MKVVSIDFDIIMSPSIEFYNDLLHDEDSIDTYLNKFPFISGIKADLYQYDCLTQYLCQMFKKLDKDKIIFITSHEELVTITKDFEPFDLINIDHHHDVGYEGERWKAPKYSKPDCGNWVKYLWDNKKINSYTWIRNKDSNPLDEDANPAYITKDILFDDFDFPLLEDADYVILCKSFEWVPFDYQILYYTWANIYDSFYSLKEDLIDKL
jgi:hypothetical protein